MTTFKFIVQKINLDLIKSYVSLRLRNFPPRDPRTWVLTCKAFNNFLYYTVVWNKTKYQKNKLLKLITVAIKNMNTDEENL